MAAFDTQIFPPEDTEHFHYYEYGGVGQEEGFNTYVAQVRELSLYDTGVVPEWGDTLLILSTCEYHVTDGRFVVVARRIREGENIQ